MGSNSIDDYSWIDDVGGGPGGEFRWALDGFGDLPSAPGVAIEEPHGSLSSLEQMDSIKGVAIEEPHGNLCSLEQMNSRERLRNDSSMVPKSKACREKMRRNKMNDRFIELSSVLDPGRAPKSDKASILSDAARVLVQLRSDAQQLKEENEKLQDTIKDLKAEKNELRDEKMKLKADKEKLEQQIEVMSLRPSGFLPHPVALHAVAASAAFTSQNPASQKTASFPQYPGITAWNWLPSAALDTTQDTKFWPPNA